MSLDVLWLGRILPVPLDSGDRIYSARLVESLARAGGNVCYAGLANPDAPSIGPESLDPAVHWQVLPGRPNSSLIALLSREPKTGGHFNTSAYRKALQRLLERNYHVIVVDHYGLAWTIPLIERAYRGCRRPIIVHIAHDYETQVTLDIARNFRGNPFHRMLLFRNARKTASAENRIIAMSDLVVTLTDHDAACFQKQKPSLRTIVVPPGYQGPRLDERLITQATPRRVVILGSFRWIAKQMNLAAFLEVADPRFAAAGIELVIIGDAEPAFRDRWLPRLRATRFLGFVDDLTTTLQDCRMGLVVEGTGGGFKLKVLDYVFMRQPVAALAASLGGQPEAVTRHFLVSGDLRELVERIIASIDDVGRLNAMQSDAFVAAEPLFSWERNGAQLLERFQNLIHEDQA